MGRGIRSVASLGAAIAATLVVAPSAATAGTVISRYEPNIQAYEPSTLYQGSLCDPGLTCPAVTNSHQTSGGAAGGPFLRTDIGSPLGASADSRGIWESPSFVYRGAKGSDPDDLTLVLYRRARTAELLDISDNSVTYTVEVVDEGPGKAVVAVPVDARPLNPATDWTNVQASVPPSRLRVGDKYAIVVITRFQTGTEAYPGASADYDKLALRATAPKPVPPPKPPTPKPNPKHFHRLVVKTKCPRRLDAHTCVIHIIAYKHAYSGPRVAIPKTVRKRGHAVKKISLRVKPKFERYAKALAKKRGRLPVHETFAAQHHRSGGNRLVKAVAYH